MKRKTESFDAAKKGVSTYIGPSADTSAKVDYHSVSVKSKISSDGRQPTILVSKLAIEKTKQGDPRGIRKRGGGGGMKG